MITINMPGGAIQNLEADELLWLRKAFDSEWKGATMLRLATDRIYSIETVNDLSNKFTDADLVLATFNAPDARMQLVVSARRVRQVEVANPAIYHKNAKSVLVFSKAVKLAVREDTDDVHKKLKP